MNAVQFVVNALQYALGIGYGEKYIEESMKTKVFGLQVNSHLKWKNHTEKIIPNLRGTQYSVKFVFHFRNITLETIFCLFSLCNEIWNDCVGVFHVSVKRYALCK